VECLGGLLGQGGEGTATVSPRRFGVAHQRHEDLALPAALTAQAAPDGVPLLLPRVGVGLQRRRAGGALLPGGMDEWEEFCCAVSRVVAAVTRGLPWSAGQVSTSRGAGLTKPSSIAAAAWRASSSALKASSIPLRHCASVSGTTQGSCGFSRGTVARPQAYMTARAVRHRAQMAASDGPPACLSLSRASRTRVGPGERPLLARLGKRRAQRCSTASTNWAQGNVSAHGRREGVVGTTSAPWRRGPRPLSPC
jgi:hypothetical protein